MKKRTARQILSDKLRSNAYKGCRGQVSDHGLGKKSIQIFADAEDKSRWPNAKRTTSGSYLVADWDI